MNRRRHPLEQQTITRRQLTAMLGGAGAVLATGGASSLLSACGAAAPTVASPATTAPPSFGAVGAQPAAGTLDGANAAKYWLHGNFAPVFEEVDVLDLP